LASGSCWALARIKAATESTSATAESPTAFDFNSTASST